jgi:hypothetical protein
VLFIIKPRIAEIIGIPHQEGDDKAVDYNL